MDKNQKIVVTIIIILAVAFFPLYFFTHVGIQEDTLQISGNVHNSVNMTLSQLKTYEPVTIQVTLFSSGKSQENGDFNYTGVLLKDLLNKAQASDNATAVFIQAADSYGTTLTLEEATSQNTIIAYQKDGVQMVPLKDSGDGFRLIVGNDTYAQRWIRGVVAIDVR